MERFVSSLVSQAESTFKLRFNERELSEVALTCVPDKEGLVNKKGPGKNQSESV